MRMASRYFATVRRAISIPASAQFFHDRVIRQYVLGTLILDQLANAMTDCLGGMRFAAIGSRDRRRKEVFQFENAATRRHVFVRSDA